MDIVKQELNNKYQQDTKKLTRKLGLINTPFVIAYVAYVYLAKPNPDDFIATFIPLMAYISVVLVLGIIYFIQLTKLGKEYQQQLSELDIE